MAKTKLETYTGTKPKKAKRGAKHSDQFVEWFDKEGTGIYFNPGTKIYTSTLSDLKELTFTEITDIRNWLSKELGRGPIESVKTDNDKEL